MIYEVKWSSASLDDAKNIVAFVKSTTGTTTSKKVINALRDAENNLSRFPFLGHLSDTYSPCRVLAAKHTNLYYIVNESEHLVSIVAVWDNRRDTDNLETTLKKRI